MFLLDSVNVRFYVKHISCFCSFQSSSNTAALILEMLIFLMDAIQTNFQQASAVGSSSRAQQALNELHTQDKSVEMTDQLMVQKSTRDCIMSLVFMEKELKVRESKWGGRN